MPSEIGQVDGANTDGTSGGATTEGAATDGAKRDAVRRLTLGQHAAPAHGLADDGVDDIALQVCALGHFLHGHPMRRMADAELLHQPQHEGFGQGVGMSGHAGGTPDPGQGYAVDGFAVSAY